ncbi:MAG: hypothetical protein ACOZBL_00060 [Patescibacteria group bacterium]
MIIESMKIDSIKYLSSKDKPILDQNFATNESILELVVKPE